MPSNVTSQNVVLDAPNLAFSAFPTSLPFRGSSAHMMHESERLKTFEGWPLSFIQPEAMSKAGFYYTKRQDIVRCPFCNIEVKNWEEGDDPLEDHKKWNPTCCFINNAASCGNVPMPENSPESDLSNPPSPTDSGYDTCGTREMLGMDIIKRNAILVEKRNSSSSIYRTRAPSFPQYASLEERRKSFSTWPVSLKIKPNILSEAGFYYTGKGDQTICFYCGGGLKDWEDSDDPWMEHARWFSKCTFVLLNKGDAFVEEARESIKPSFGDEPCMKEPAEVKDAAESEKLLQITEEPVAGSSANSSGGTVSDAMLCKLCYSKGLEVVFLPCGHLMSCIDCSIKLTNCGICRKPIKEVLRTFVS